MTPFETFSEKSSILVLQSLPKGSLKLRRVRGCLHAWVEALWLTVTSPTVQPQTSSNLTKAPIYKTLRPWR